MKVNFFHALHGMIDTTYLYVLPLAACNPCARATSESWLCHCIYDRSSNDI